MVAGMRERSPARRASGPLNVTNGDCAAAVIRGTTLPGRVLAWNDVLHEGPLLAGRRAGFREARAAFLSACGWGARTDIAAQLEARDAILEEALSRECGIVLWFEHDLYDQLQLVEILALLASRQGEPAAAELVQVGDVPGEPEFKGLGELAPEELAPLRGRGAPVTREVLTQGRAAWAALCAPDPRKIASAAATDHPELPYLRAALVRLLEELPDSRTGLSRSERQALEAVRAGAATPIDAYLASERREQAPFLGDAWFWRRIGDLGRGRNRLLAAEAGGDVPVPPPLGDASAYTATRLSLTETGVGVLAGRLDRVELLGIDRWLGGTHLRRGNVWRWDRDHAAVVSP